MRSSVVLLLALLANCAVAQQYVPKDLVWKTPSANSSGSMPCGGHDIGLNVWAEGGDVLIYLSQSGWFDENNTLLKAGRLRIHSSVPFGGSDFCQTLRLADGSVSVVAQGVSLRVWADVFSPVVFVDYKSKSTSDLVVSFESWRHKDRVVSKAECQQCSYKWIIPNQCVTFADSISPSAQSLVWSHANKQETVFGATLRREGVEALSDSIYDPIGGRVMTGCIEMPGLSFIGCHDGVYASTDFRAWDYKGRLRSTTIKICLSTTESQANAEIPTLSQSQKRSAQWWRDFWNRSFIRLTDVSCNDSAQMVVRNYELCRYMLGCNAYGAWPTKFNGGLFTFDPVYVDSLTPFTPDYRRWGGGTMTAQNQRLVYWPMVRTADTTMLRSQLDTYLRMLPAAQARTRFYWGHNGASFSEQIENFGFPNIAEFGKQKPGHDLGTERNAWLEHLWDTSLEFCQMALEAHDKFDMDISMYEGMIWQCLVFFDEHYQKISTTIGLKPLNADGKLVIYPGSACETYKMAYNPSSTIAALRVVGESWAKYVSTDSLRKSMVYGLLSRVPDIPLRHIDGDTCIAPAIVWARVQNVESPQLYPVFPWRIYGVGRPDLHIALNTWKKDSHVLAMRSAKGWKQDVIWAACLGLPNEAAVLVFDKLKDGPFRFPAFYDQGFDWAPDLNRAGSGMIGLQEMLLQFDASGERIDLPAWPSRWGRVEYKLY